MSEWYVSVMGEASGPYSLDEMRTLIRQKRVMPESDVRHRDEKSWTMASTVAELFPQEQIELIQKEIEKKRAKPVQGVPVVSTETYTLPGYEIDKTLSVVVSRRVYGINILKELFLVGGRDLVGGRSKSLETSFQNMEAEVRGDLMKQAHDKGAHAIVKYQYDQGAIEYSNSMLLYATAQGTPVVLSKIVAGIEIDDNA